MNSSYRSLPATAEQKTLVYYEQSMKKLSDEKQHWWGQAHKAMKANEHHRQWGIQLKQRCDSLEQQLRGRNQYVKQLQLRIKRLEYHHSNKIRDFNNNQQLIRSLTYKNEELNLKKLH